MVSFCITSSAVLQRFTMTHEKSVSGISLMCSVTAVWIEPTVTKRRFPIRVLNFGKQSKLRNHWWIREAEDEYWNQFFGQKCCDNHRGVRWGPKKSNREASLTSAVFWQRRSKSFLHRIRSVDNIYRREDPNYFCKIPWESKNINYLKQQFDFFSVAVNFHRMFCVRNKALFFSQTVSEIQLVELLFLECYLTLFANDPCTSMGIQNGRFHLHSRCTRYSVYLLVVERFAAGWKPTMSPKHSSWLAIRVTQQPGRFCSCNLKRKILFVRGSFSIFKLWPNLSRMRLYRRKWSDTRGAFVEHESEPFWFEIVTRIILPTILVSLMRRIV